ncbi:hypothetical protein BHM03_00001478 [Ensete ventricosum]|nr:hypothetical protein BHM03_00001478 [Ensete ventricosum]
MGGISGFGSGSRLLEWWSSGRAEVCQLGSIAVFQLGSVADSCKKVGSAGARVYIVGVVDHMYLATRLPLWLTLSSYASTTPVVVAVDCTTAGNSALPVPGRPHDHWRPHTCVRPASRVGSITSVGQLSEGAMMWRPGHYVPYHQRTPVTLNILAEYTAKIDDKGIVDRRRAGIKATPGDSPRRREKRETLAPTLTYKRERFDTGERRQRHSHLKVLT